MSNAGRHIQPLSRAIYGFVGLGAVMATIIGWFVVSDRLANFQQSALSEAVTVRANGLQLDFSRALYEEWQSTKTIAQVIAKRNPDEIRSSLDLLIGDNTRVSWAGIAGLDGTVLVAAKRLLEGQNVSSRPWFQQGLEGDYAGNVHEAVLLAKLLPSTDGEPRRFIDLATPVHNIQGQTSGVLGVHIDFAWAQAYLTEMAKTLEIDAFLVDQDGKVILSTDGNVQSDLALPSIRAAASGSDVSDMETWPDGRTYLTTVIPQVSYRDLPSFGWSLAARIDSEAIRDKRQALSNGLLVILAGLVVLLAIGTYIFVQMFALPFRRLAASADSVLKGHEVYPFESRSTAEAATLSAAIARLQSHQMNRTKERVMS
jgi:hypothetical protein